MFDILEFEDPKTKKKFRTSSYKIIKKKRKRFALAISPNDNEAWRLL